MRKLKDLFWGMGITALLALLIFPLLMVIHGFVSIGPSVVETTVVSFRAENFTAGVEALVTVTPQRAFVDGTPATTFAVPSGRLLTLQTLCVGVKNAGAAIQSVQVKLRVNPKGAAVIDSPVVTTMGISTYVATAGVANANCIALGDGLQLSGLNQLSITQVGSALAGFDVVLSGMERAL